MTIELRAQGCADDLQQVTDNLASGLDEVRAVEKGLKRSRAPLSKKSPSPERTASQPAMHDQKTGLPDAVPTPPDASIPLEATIKVLLAEDDGFMRDLMYRVLASAGMQVASYASAAELLSAGDLMSATVLLLDVKMPGMSGLDLQDLLRRRGIERPIVFISGDTDLAMAVTAMRNGAADFIEKPFQGALLIERVRRAVTRHAERLSTSEHRRPVGFDPLRDLDAPGSARSSICL